MKRRSGFVFTFFMIMLLAGSLFTAAPAFSDVTYQTVPITLQMEAGRGQWNAWTSGTTIIAGTGWLQPFGRADYHYGFGYAESTAELRPDFMDDPSWMASYPTANLCIYHLEDGDIYAYDGIIAGLEPDNGDGKTDYLLEVIVGGTGRYENAKGILLGRAAGRGSVRTPTPVFHDPQFTEPWNFPDEPAGPPFPLPPVIIKVMEGYINIEVEESEYEPALPAIGTKNPQMWPDARDYLAAGELIPINLEFEAGRDQWNPYPLGDEGTVTFIAGTGWIEPFGRSDYHYGANFPETREGGAVPKPDYMNDTWLGLFPTNNLCVYDMGDGVIYAYDGIMGNLEPASPDGKADYILEVIVGGTEGYEGATGIIVGHTTGRGGVAVPTSGDASGPFPLPDSILKIMEGYIIIK